MQMVMAFLQSVIYAVSACLLWPVMAGLVALSAWVLVYGGGFFAEWLTRFQRRRRNDVTNRLNDIHRQRRVPAEVMETLSPPVRRYLIRLMALLGNRDVFFDQKLESLIQTSEYDLSRHVDRLRLVVRIGPGLGLMGTLIPMSTGLAALTQGNLSQVSSSLIIAFTTTVVGLAIGITAQVFATAKTRWVQEDIRAMELLADALTREAGL